MADQTQDQGSTIYFFVGLLVGGLAGAAVSLMLAPRSGQETRDQIQRKGIELRNEATETANSTVAQVRRRSQQVSTEVGEKVGELKQRGQKLIDEQREHFSTVLASENNEVKVS
jgi:gas vesicle protein